MQTIPGYFQVRFNYAVHFTTDLFAPANRTFLDAIGSDETARVLLVVEEEMDGLHAISTLVSAYFEAHHDRLELAGPILRLPGGEQVKNDPSYVQAILEAMHHCRLDRQSYLGVIGGGALLDAAGFAAATAHRGVRLIRIPTTTLSQADSGIGVKNGINAFGKKNFLGTFAPAWAVLNDSRFLATLPTREWRGGIAEAIKVALIKDAAFFARLEQAMPALAARDLPAMAQMVHHCAELHVQHICSGGDPFETGASRPLDFGHWSAHKLESLTDYDLRHGEAVAIGLALDATYSHAQGWLTAADLRRITGLLGNAGFALYHPALEMPELSAGLEEFREHLGGNLTIQMLRSIGAGFDVHSIDQAVMRQSIAKLRSEPIVSVTGAALGAVP